MEYTKFLTRARKLRANQATQEHLFLELLVEQEEAMLDWKKPKSPYDNWADLLRGERFCTLATYQSYKKARSLISQNWIKKLGVYASISVAKLDADSRTKILTTVQKWYGEHNVPPTYQLVSQYVRKLGRGSRKTSTTTAKLRAYIKNCQDLLIKHKIPVPKETWKK